MQFRDYFSRLSASEKKRLASDVGVTLRHLFNVACGSKPMSKYLAVALEEASRGLLRRTDLRPDLRHDI